MDVVHRLPSLPWAPSIAPSSFQGRAGGQLSPATGRPRESPCSAAPGLGKAPISTRPPDAPSSRAGRYRAFHDKCALQRARRGPGPASQGLAHADVDRGRSGGLEPRGVNRLPRPALRRAARAVAADLGERPRPRIDSRLEEAERCLGSGPPSGFASPSTSWRRTWRCADRHTRPERQSASRDPSGEAQRVGASPPCETQR